MTKTFLFLTLSFLVGCTSQTVSRTDFLKGPAPDGASLEAVQKELTRSQKYLGQFEVSATLLSGPLIELEERARVSRDVASQAQNEAIKQIRKSMAEERTCFRLTLNTMTMEGAHFRHFDIKARDSERGVFALEFNTEPGSPKPIRGLAGFDYGNTAIGCTTRPINLSKTFRVEFQSNTSADESELVWEIR